TNTEATAAIRVRSRPARWARVMPASNTGRSTSQASRTSAVVSDDLAQRQIAQLLVAGVAAGDGPGEDRGGGGHPHHVPLGHQPTQVSRRVAAGAPNAPQVPRGAPAAPQTHPARSTPPPRKDAGADPAVPLDVSSVLRIPA